eukprot:TRINITY_DN7590_c0_g1_i1.p1 TRINITY_DN7590_c0_g1~~TRINITY_DN7590_c0_g1_i1.p1  ORF type:complete len:269 (+),score=91.83 TRINITY_DN7590_c0_g1_i1:132-938(+)
MIKKQSGKEIENGWEEIGMEGWIQCRSCHLHIMVEDAESMGCPRCGQIYFTSKPKKEDSNSSIRSQREFPLLSSAILFQLFSQNSGPDPAPILDFLFLGSRVGVSKKATLDKLEAEFRKKNSSASKEGNIIHILNVAEEVKNKFPEEYDYKNYLLEDVEDEDILVHLEETSNWIAKIKSMNEIVIVHCAAGVSRSATVVLAYLMKNERMTLKDAYSFLKEKRSVIAPNSGFLAQLMEYEKQLFGQCSVSSVTELDPRALLISCNKKKD